MKLLFLLLISIGIKAQSSPATAMKSNDGLSVNNPDNSAALQRICDNAIKNGTQKIVLESGHYNFKHPVIIHNWQAQRNIYFPFTIQIIGTGSYSGADGTGTIFDFSGCTSCAFGIGIQGMKGGGISGITLIGRWKDPGLSGYQFYNTSLGNGPCKNTPFGPESAIVIDPFGPSKVEGGYDGNDANGTPLTNYYRGSSNGSTGIDIHDIKFQHWLVGIIISPSGGTFNGELMHWYKQNMQWVRFPYIGCQPQEKANEIGPEIECWGPTECIFQLGHGWGLSQPGNYHLHDWNVAGAVQSLLWINEGGYYSTHVDHIFAETLGKIGYWASGNGSSFTESVIDFANYIDGSMSYTFGQIDGHGVAYNNNQFRMYGTYQPVTIYNHDGFNSFTNCAFDKVPYYNTDYPTGQMTFTNCKFRGTQIANPTAGIQMLSSTERRYQPTYTVKPSLEGRYYQATIACKSNELDSVKVGTVIVAYNKKSIQQGIMGVVTKVGAKDFTISYVPKHIVPGEYYLYKWETQNK